MFTSHRHTMNYQEVMETMSLIATPLSLYLMPENYDEEKQKFLSETTYNPQFIYRHKKMNIGVFSKLQRLTEISDVDPEVSSYIIQTIQSKKQAAALLDAIGSDDSFVHISEARFGKPSYILFKRACGYLRGYYGDIRLAEREEKLRHKQLTYTDLVPIFETVFSLLGLDGWVLEKSKAIASGGFRTTAKSKRIMVDPDISVSAEKLRKTIIHEVGTHALRAHNGFLSGYEVFGKPNLVEYLDDEEGLAMYNEERFGLLRDVDIKRRSALVYAMYIGIDSSFRKTFNALSSVYPKRNAFDVVFRVKRGLSNTAHHGCYYRDASYLRGFIKIRKKLASDSVSYANMYAGKIPYSHLHLVEEGILKKPRVVPTEEVVSEIFSKTGLK